MPLALRAGGTIIPPSRLGNNCRRRASPDAVPRRVRRASLRRRPGIDAEGCVRGRAAPRRVRVRRRHLRRGTASYDVRMPSYARTGKNFLNISIPTLLNADLGSVMDAPSCALTPKKTHIVCTLGPSSRTVDDLEKLLYAGMSVARFNL